jgi:hypothetical protein
LVENVVDSFDRPGGHRQIREVALLELDLAQMLEVSPLTRNQAVDHADSLSSTDELFGQVRSDESGAASDEVGSHIDGVGCKSTAE